MIETVLAPLRVRDEPDLQLVRSTPSPHSLGFPGHLLFPHKQRFKRALGDGRKNLLVPHANFDRDCCSVQSGVWYSPPPSSIPLHPKY